MAQVQRNRSGQLFDGGFPYSATVLPGSTLFTAGISPLDEQGRITPPGDVVGQMRTCLRNLRVVLAEQGAAFADIAKLTIYVAERLQADLVVAWQAVVEEFDDDVPAAMMLGVTVLAYDDQLVEVEAIAALPA